MTKTLKAAKIKNAVVQLDRSDQEITYDKLKEHIKKNHPTKLVKEGDDADKIRYFSIFESLGLLPIMMCCNKKPSPLAQELGIGASLFLMTTRSLGTFFVILTIINIPIFAFYYSGTQSASQGEGSASEATSFTDYFSLLSLGNAGTSSYACDSVNFSLEDYTI